MVGLLWNLSEVREDDGSLTLVSTEVHTCLNWWHITKGSFSQETSSQVFSSPV